MRRRIACLILAGSLILTSCQNQEDGKVYTAVSSNGAEYVTDNYILIEKQDLTKMGEEDAAAVSEIEGIKRVELYGTANRINYYCNSGTDYEEGEQGVLEIKDKDKTMRSAGNLTEKDLSAGQLPKKMDEIVLFSSDKSMLGAKLKICLYDCEYMGQPEKMQDFSNNYWADTASSMYSYGGYCLEQEFTVTGLLEKKTTQVYFSEDYCTMISRTYAGNLYSNSCMVRFNGTKEQGLEDLPGELSLTGDTRLGVNRSVRLSLVYGELDWNKQAQYRLYPANETFPCLYVYQEGCSDNEVRISERLAQYNIDDSVGSVVSLYRILLLGYVLPEGGVYEGDEWMEDELSCLGLTNVCVRKRPECSTLVNISEETHSSGAYVIGVGQKLFDRIYGTDGSYEMAVFPEEGTDIQELTEKLSEAGYEIYQKKSLYETYDRTFDDSWEIYYQIDGKNVAINRENYKDYLE